MEISWHSKPSYAMAICHLDAGETIRAEAGAMAAMSDGVTAGADVGPGGAGKGLMRKVLGGEGFFMAKYTAQVQGAWVALTPPKPGDIEEIYLDGNHGLVAEAGSLLALEQGVDADVRWAGMRNIVMREGATMLHLEGQGKALLCSYGGIVRHQLHDQSMIVDTGHLVAYSDTLQVRIGPLSGLVTSALSGEGLVAQLSGTGVVFIQTRSDVDAQSWLFPERAQNKKR